MKSRLALVTLALVVPTAHASPFNFSYTRTTDNKVLVGQLDGTLQPDGNTVVVNSILNAPSLSGNPGVTLPFVRSTDFANFGTAGLSPKASLNGSFMDFFAYSNNTSNGGSGFAFAAGDRSAATFGRNGSPFVGFDGVYGLTTGGNTTGFAEDFVASRWTLSPTAIASGHVTDGSFTSPTEWAGPNVSKVFFPVVGQSGGAYLYVEQGFRQQQQPLAGPNAIALGSPDTLFLMYDYVNSNALGFNSGNAFFDVFFQVNRPVDPDDYLVRISASGFQAFERPSGSTPPTRPNGSFDIGSGSGWTPLDAADLALAGFHAAISQGSSPDLAAGHLMAEFDLSIDNSGPPGRNGNNGLYDPAPAFWSASVGSVNDPPISSAIFSLSPTGPTTVTPVLGPNGGPISVPQQVVPEPSTLLLAMLGLGVAGWNGRRKDARDNG